MFESSLAKPGTRFLDRRLLLPLALAIVLVFTRQLFLNWRYIWLAYILGAAVAIYLPVPECRTRFAIRSTILGVLFTPNLLIGHGIFVLPAWMSLTYPMIPGIIPLSVAVCGLFWLTLATHRAAHRDHPRSEVCRQPVRGSYSVFPALVLLFALFYPLEGGIDQITHYLIFRSRTSGMEVLHGVSYQEARFVVMRLHDLQPSERVTSVTRAGANIIVETRDTSGSRQRFTFLGGARGTRMLPETIR